MQAEKTIFERAKERLAERDRERDRFNSSVAVLLGGAKSLTQAVNAYERTIIFEALRLSDGRIVSTAKLLGISYQTLSYIIDSRHSDAGLRHKPKATRRRLNDEADGAVARQ